MKFGIVGFGRFGQLWTNALLPFGEVFVYDKSVITILLLKKYVIN